MKGRVAGAMRKTGNVVVQEIGPEKGDDREAPGQN
jgi:hypothetical protein